MVKMNELIEQKLKELEAGLTDIENKIENMERTRLRQEGAIMAMKQLLEEVKGNEDGEIHRTTE